jgi:small-conductance mechanosensitive channel
VPHDNDNVSLTIDIGPGLSQALKDIVAYLNNRDSQQKQIDTLSTQVTELTDQLSKSTSDLQGSVDTTKT